MATIKTRPRADGTPTYRVMWRKGGTRDGSWESETFLRKTEATRFRRDVDATGQDWPEGWVKGVGYVSTGPEPIIEVPFLPYAQTYVRDLTGITPATRHRYDRQVAALDQQLRPIVGADLTVANLEEVHVRRWVNAREAAGARPKTIANYHGLLYTVLAAAARAGLRPGNPCSGTRLPDRYSPDETGDRDAVFLTETQFALIATAMFPITADGVRRRRRPRSAAGKHAGTVEDRWLVEAAVGTGLRWSELTALQVQDLDLDAAVPRLSVKRAWKRNPMGEFTIAGAGAFYLGKPKSKKSRRRITLSPAVVAVLRRAVQGKAPGDLVCTAPQGGALNQATWYEDRWQVALALAAPRGLTVTPRFHDLRHTHAAWLISAGVPLPVIQQRLGHESITTTVDTYGGLLLQAHEVADAAIDAALAGRSIPPPGRVRSTDAVVPAADQDVVYDPVLDAELQDAGDEAADEP
jgi:integrase